MQLVKTAPASPDDKEGSSASTISEERSPLPEFPSTPKEVTIRLRLMNINKNSQITGTKN
ncbi:hypothetical protein [Tychonema sp. BBK16]|uniref:hypothetical protein n=1 Tax=Tychonema sp. BBK16 TaxID=2699888 RepID=UPI0030D9FE23